MPQTNYQKKMRKNFSYSPIFRYIAETSSGLLDLAVTVFLDPYQLVRDAGLSGMYTSKQVAAKSSYLRNSKYFQKNNLTGQYQLTSAGRVGAIQARIWSKEEALKQNWDGLYRAVGFDIVEEQRRGRTLLRRELRSLGLVELQHSLWVTPLDVQQELLCLLQLWKVELKGDVLVFLIQDLHNDTDLRKYFGLRSKK